MSNEKQIDIITELLIDFDEMGFAPTTLVPDPEAYAIEWRKKLTNALRDEFGKLTAENETLRICLKDQRGRNAIFQRANEELAKQCEEYKAELLQMPNIRTARSEWISVEARLPDKQGHFLIVDKEGQMNTAFYTPRFGWFSHFRIKNITHWMPLPDAPKGGAE